MQRRVTRSNFERPATPLEDKKLTVEYDMVIIDEKELQEQALAFHRYQIQKMQNEMERVQLQQKKSKSGEDLYLVRHLLAEDIILRGIKAAAVPMESRYTKEQVKGNQGWYDLWCKLNVRQIRVIRDAFVDTESGDLKDKGITIIEFVEAFKKALQFEQALNFSRDQLTALTCELTELFERIDINGDLIMQWEELTGFIMENADTLLHANEITVPIAPYRSYTEEWIEDDFEKTVEKAVYFRELDLIGIIVANRKSWALFHTDGTMFRELHGHHSRVINIGHLPSAEMLVSSSSDRSVVFWSLKSYSIIKRTYFGSIHMVFYWSEVFLTFFSGSLDGTVHKWDMMDLHVQVKMRGHSDIVTGIVELPGHNLLLTCSLDRDFRVWDMWTGKCLRVIPQNITMHILKYSIIFRIALSVGFDHKIYMTTPIIENSPSLILGSHDKPIIAMELWEISPELYTMDELGEIRIWDLRYQRIVQMIRPPSSKPPYSCFCVDYLQKHIHVFGKTWETHRLVINEETLVTTDAPVAALVYSAHFACIYVLAGNELCT
jgi:hypothetical protein